MLLRTPLLPARLGAAVLAAIALSACTSDDSGDPNGSANASSLSTPRYSFTDVAESSGVTREPTRTWGAAWADFDDNGYPDLFVNRHKSKPDLFVNDGGRFTLDDDWTEAMDRHTCAWADATLDGRFDMYCTRGARQGQGVGPNHFLVQTEDGFVNQADDYGIEDPYGRGRTINWLDYDGDDDMDLFVGNKKREGGYRFALFSNEGDQFTSEKAGLGGQWSMIGSSWSDWDVDGDPDLLLLQYPDLPGMAWANDDGTFVEARIPRLGGDSWFGGAWGDYDGDGWPDLHLVGADSSILFHNEQGRLTVEETMRVSEGRNSVWFDVENDGDLDLFIARGAEGSNPSDNKNLRDLLYVQRNAGFDRVDLDVFAAEANGDSEGVAAADYDRDGRVDLFVPNGYRQWSGLYELFRNTSRAGNWVGLEIDGSQTNPHGLGARIQVTTESLDYHREITDGVNFRSQSEIGYVHLGLRGADSAEIRIDWPDGASDCFEAQANEIMDATQGASPCA